MPCVYTFYLYCFVQLELFYNVLVRTSTLGGTGVSRSPKSMKLKDGSRVGGKGDRKGGVVEGLGDKRKLKEVQEDVY